MKALVKYAKGNGNMEIRDVPEPKPGPGQVKIEVKAAGICGSDLHIYHDDIAIPLNPPVVTGHEFCGVVVEVGEGVTAWKPGDRVTSETAFSFCGKCHYCITGYYNLCNERRTLGYWYNGAFAKYTVVLQERVHVLSDSIDFISGALLEPLACVTHAVLELTTITVGDVVLVVGPGAIGLATLQVAKAQGATVVVSGTSIDKERLEMAKKLGADYTINVQEEDLQKFIWELTKGRGVDVVLECSGVARAADDALKVIKKQGQFTQIGLFGKPITIDFERICFKELKVTGSLGSRWTSWEKAIQLVEQGKVRTKPLVSHEMPITEWEKAFRMFENKEGLKLVLIPVEN
ncbi:MAG: putative arabitol-phosphate dehydrogenase [Clostridia bacterium]|jgi:L-iditol 2-dehydrogenase|nr:putative arabitol-phosphate dehydrogenase [Clostridia bacterium]